MGHSDTALGNLNVANDWRITPDTQNAIQSAQVNELWMCGRNTHVWGCSRAEKCKCGLVTRNPQAVQPVAPVPPCPHCGKVHA